MNSKSRNQLKTSGMSQLAMSMALPHEHKPARFPVVPVVPTATVSLMSDSTFPVNESSSRRAVLCRDPSYPLWIDQTVTSAGVFFEHLAGVEGWYSPTTSGEEVFTNLPVGTLYGAIGLGIPNIDGKDLTANTAVDALGVVGTADGYGVSLYIPVGSRFTVIFYDTPTAGVVQIDVDLVYYREGMWNHATVVCVQDGPGYVFQGQAGGTTPDMGSIPSGSIPCGFIKLVSARTRAGDLPIIGNPTLRWGWVPSGYFLEPTGSCTVLLPAFFPPEFQNSVIPYAKTRANATAALFTNVTAVLNKEGTILAARVKSATRDFCRFTANDINAVHPSYRYYGAMEKGLYTFTTPSVDDSILRDAYDKINSNSQISSAFRPLFQTDRVGVYNALIFTDIAATATTLAVSLYTHLEFEVVSSLFTPGVSTATLEMLHAAEIALVKFGHFHENPLHWALLAAAARKALGYVAPMVMQAAAPYVQKAGNALVARATSYLTDRARAMKQTPPGAAPQKGTRGVPKRKARVVKRK